jgi:hypothetical protein
MTDEVRRLVRQRELELIRFVVLVYENEAITARRDEISMNRPFIRRRR